MCQLVEAINSKRKYLPGAHLETKFYLILTDDMKLTGGSV